MIFVIVTALVFILLLSALVLIHEFGHYWVAKKFGIKVEEFGFGFPPKVWGVKKGETEYTINLLPIGGFVKLYGEDEVGGGKVTLSNKTSGRDDKAADLSRAFFARPAWQRASVILAGVVMNVFLAIVIYYVFLGLSNFKTEIPLLGDHKFFGTTQTNRADVIIGEVAKDSPAAKVGLPINSRVVAVNDQPITTSEEFIKLVNVNRGKEIKLTTEDLKTKDTKSVRLTPRLNPPKDQGALGVRFSIIDIAVLSYESASQKILSGIIHPLNLLVYNLDVVGKLIAVSFQQKTAAPISQGVAGPVGIVTLVNIIVQIENAKEVFLQLLNLAGILSISLAFFNVLPIPALDGGRLFFVLIEMVTRRRVSPKIESLAHAVGFAVLMLLIVLVTFNDIVKLIPGMNR